MVTGVHVFVVGPTAYHMAYHGAEVMVRVLPPSMIAAARDKYNVKTIYSMPPGEFLSGTTHAYINIFKISFRHLFEPKDYIMRWLKQKSER